jgi:hypothetical protein
VKSSNASTVLQDQHSVTESHTKVENVLIIMEALWRNNLNLIKDVPMIYVNFIIVVIIVSKKKIEGIIFIPLLVQYKMLSRCL